MKSAQLRALARAFNDRLRAGPGDTARRVAQFYLNALRQIRNSDGSLTPALAEFHTFYQGIEPEIAEWPDTGPGDPAGVNLSSLLPAYVHGSDSLDLHDEGARLTDPTYGGMPVEPAGGDPVSLWELGKAQRGAYDPDTGAMNCPAFTAARSYAAIRFSRWVGHGNAFGGYLPTPEISTTPCEDPDASDAVGAPVNYEIFFTGLNGAPNKTYAGTCQDGPSLSTPGMYDDHVFAIGEAPWAWYVVLNDGTVEELSKSDYIEGPYTGSPKLVRTWGQQIEFIAHRYIGNFRGSEQAEAEHIGARPKQWNTHAFSVRQFMRRQYLLAPARGVELGESIQCDYPRVISTAYAGAEITSHADCVYSAFLARGTGLLEVLSGGEVVRTVNVTDAKIVTLDTAVQSIAFRSDSRIEVELLEQMNYRPHIYDMLLIVRVGAARL